MDLVLDLVVSEDLFQQVSDNVKNSKVVKSTLGGISYFVDRVLDSVGRDKMTAWKEITPQTYHKISVLRVWSHGYVNFANSEKENGNMIFGNGKENLTAENFKDFRKFLANLTSYFAKPARVELRGCIPAKGTGEKMMLDLANLWKVDVYGSDKYMPQILSWASTVYVARPGAAKIILTRGPEVN